MPSAYRTEPRARVKALVWLVMAVLCPTKGMADTADYTRTPVLMLHGWFFMDDAGTATWAMFKKRMVADGWPEEFISTPSFTDVRGCDPGHAQEIAAFVDDLLARTGADRVDIVAHSEGALNTLYYLKFLCGVHKVRNFVALAGAFHGTAVACMDITESCGAKEMCVPKPLAWQENEMLAEILAGDETPGDVLYTSIYSSFDEIIVPPTSSVLAGARNIEVKTDWVEHAGIFMCDECYDLMKDALLNNSGLNEDGPGWESIPACAPSGPEQDYPDMALELETAPDVAEMSVAPKPRAEPAVEPGSPEIFEVFEELPTRHSHPPAMTGCAIGPCGDIRALLPLLLLIVRRRTYARRRG